MKTAEMRFPLHASTLDGCFGNQEWAEEVGNKNVVLKISLFKLSESFKLIAHGVLEMFEEVYLCVPPPPPRFG